MKKKLPVVFLVLCLAWWGALAVLRVSGETATMQAQGGSVLATGGGIVAIVATTTTTTIPAPENLITNGTFASADGWTQFSDPASSPQQPVIYTGPNGYCEASWLTPGGPGDCTLEQSINITNGWTYALTYTAWNVLYGYHSIDVQIGGNIVCIETNGTWTQTVTAISTVGAIRFLWASWDGDYFGAISNLQLHIVSAP
jgi:hypothetical protein